MSPNCKRSVASSVTQTLNARSSYQSECMERGHCPAYTRPCKAVRGLRRQCRRWGGSKTVSFGRLGIPAVTVQSVLNYSAYKPLGLKTPAFHMPLAREVEGIFCCVCKSFNCSWDAVAFSFSECTNEHGVSGHVNLKCQCREVFSPVSLGERLPETGHTFGKRLHTFWCIQFFSLEGELSCDAMPELPKDA